MREPSIPNVDIEKQFNNMKNILGDLGLNDDGNIDEGFD